MRNIRSARNACVILTLATLLAAATTTLLAGDAAERPNIVVILADDMGTGDVSIYNADSKIPTPYMDALARQGLRMTDMHSPSAVCTPTRYGLLTGRYCWRTRLKASVLFGYDTALIKPSRMTLASMLRKHGYATAAFGKWHLGLGSGDKTDYSKPFSEGPLSVGFDTFYGIPASLDMHPYVFVHDTKVVEAPTETIGKGGYIRHGGTGYMQGGPIAPSFKPIDVLPVTTDKTVEFIEAQSKEKPFFVYVPFSAPHTPWAPTKEFLGKSKAGVYGDFTVMVDHCIGRILAAVEKQGFAENTLVIVTSDNGSHWTENDKKKHLHLGNMNLRGQKADIHEGGHRVPFIVRWPDKIQPDSTSDQLGSLTDVFASVAAVVGEPLAWDAGEDSVSLLPVWTEDKPVREAIVHHSGRGLFSIRRGDWKLIVGLGTGGFTEPWWEIKPKDGEAAGQLYNLADDLGETKNLWLDKPEIVKELTALLEQYQQTGRSR